MAGGLLCGLASIAGAQLSQLTISSEPGKSFKAFLEKSEVLYEKHKLKGFGKGAFYAPKGCGSDGLIVILTGDLEIQISQSEDDVGLSWYGGSGGTAIYAYRVKKGPTFEEIESDLGNVDDIKGIDKPKSEKDCGSIQVEAQVCKKSKAAVEQHCIAKAEYVNGKYKLEKR